MPTEEELARLRIQEEQQKIISSTNKTRKLKQRQLIGEQAEDVTKRKDHVEDAKRQWSAKGTEGQTHGADQIDQNVTTKAKSEYATNLQKFTQKGVKAPSDIPTPSEIPQDLKAKYDKPKTKLPSLFRKKNTTTTTTETSSSSSPQPPPPKDKTAGKSTNYAEEFYKIEKEEIKMVGTAKHITITGIDKSGRRVTKTKIILPEQVGETKIQTQQGGLRPKTGGETGSNNNNNSNNPLVPKNFDGKYYSLTDIRQRRVEGMDKNNREQYLSPKDFQEAFKMTKEEFAKLPKWKRDNLKRDLHLY